MIEILNIQDTKEHKGFELIYGYYDVLAKLPNNATNGDMIKAIFPNQTIGCAIPITDRNGAKFYRTTINGVTDFTKDWWNAPYRKVEEE